MVDSPAPSSAILCGAWATSADVPERLKTGDLAVITDAEWDLYLQVAGEVLYALSGRQFRGEGCSESAVLRPTPPSPGGPEWPYAPTLEGCACWLDPLWPGAARALGQARPHAMAVRLPRDDVTGITQVLEGTTVLNSATYRLVRRNWVERLDTTWADCGSTTTTFTYGFGQAPPEVGQQACVALAAELARSWLGLSCKLPANVSQVTRQGVTITNLDPNDFLDKGRTGIGICDLFLAAVNPHGQPRRARVWSPDLPTALRA